jgi:glucose/arabinose dehydrogenase/mono/diheme cytochrome c family protein
MLVASSYFPLVMLRPVLPFLAAALVLPLSAADTPAPKKKNAPRAASAAAAAADSARAAWVEPDFPFFSSVLDARKAGADLPADNLTPRGIILNLGRDCWACFDPDLLRVSAVWRGAGVKPTALAPGSYHDVSRKTPGGQTNLPTPEGALWLANGIHPGWQAGDTFSLDDPREPAPSPEEVGRGPLPEALGRFNALRLVRDGVVLEYVVAGTAIREWFTSAERNGQTVIERHMEIAPAKTPLRLVLGRKNAGTTIILGESAGPDSTVALAEEKSTWTLRVAPRPSPITVALAFSSSGTVTAPAPRAIPSAPTGARWPQEVVTAAKLSTAQDAYVVDHFALPEPNPWKRGFRPADIQFLSDGTGVVPTLDGDVWLVRGLGEAAGRVRWRRFASGLHEPMTVAIRDDEIFAFDKNGVWRLRDTDGDGEADMHELFSNCFSQTADMREFASQIRLAPGGEFVIAKGGQQATTLGKHNGSVLRLSADGRSANVLGYGFRQPNIGVNPRTGLVTSSDQQGQYIPSTPLHIVRDRQFYGFLAPFQPREKYPAPPTEPLTWIPHPINTSAISQAWLLGARMGPLDDALVHIGFNKPELFRVLLNERGARPQAAVVSITRAFEFTPLNGSVNPRDGQFYLAGFQVLGWGNILEVAGGLGRVRTTGAPVTIPREVVPTDRGVLVKFDVALDPRKAADPASYSLQTWGYQRTYKYGSPQFKADGTPGQDSLTPSAAYLARDGKSVFIAVPGLKPVQQLRVGWSLATAAGAAFDDNAYTTPYELAQFDPRAEGFGDIAIDLTPRAAVAQIAGPVTVEEGKRVAQMFACVACHFETGNRFAERAGPTWRGLAGSERKVFIDGQPATVTADDAYLRESILNAAAKVAAGFEKGEFAMPSYAGVLTDSQIDSLVLYIRSLK